jgi:hypothetical protein
MDSRNTKLLSPVHCCNVSTYGYFCPRIGEGAVSQFSLVIHIMGPFEIAMANNCLAPHIPPL